MIIDDIARNAAELASWRRDIHAHPELGYQEERTSRLVAERLEAFGCEVHRGLGKTGVVGRLSRGTSGRTVGLRADMDALPITEANSFPHRSQHQGRMHACGHDGHTTMLLGAARHLAAHGVFDGTVNFIFQPAEEGGAGADAMIKDGLFERFPCDAVFGMHNMPGLAVGAFSTRPGPTMAGVAIFEILIEGLGGHGAMPESAIDPVVVASQITLALQTIVSRNIRPFDPAVLSVTRIEAGEADNVIPPRARLRGTARAFTEATMSLIGERMARLADNIAAGFGATAKIDFRVTYPPLINHPEETRFAADVAAALVGEANVRRDGVQLMAGEDFSFMLNARPGAFIYIGNGEGEGSCEVHNPHYDFNDAVLPLGASLWTRLVETRLVKG
ncbi:MAG: M20 aminoacylase family protein [Stellaceae bacterium]